MHSTVEATRVGVARENIFCRHAPPSSWLVFSSKNELHDVTTGKWCAASRGHMHKLTIVQTISSKKGSGDVRANGLLTFKEAND